VHTKCDEFPAGRSIGRAGPHAATALPGPASALMSIAAVASYLELSVRTVEKLKATGELPPAVEVPGCGKRMVRFLRADIDAMVARWAEG